MAKAMAMTYEVEQCNSYECDFVALHCTKSIFICIFLQFESHFAFTICTSISFFSRLLCLIGGRYVKPLQPDKYHNSVNSNQLQLRRYFIALFWYIAVLIPTLYERSHEIYNRIDFVPLFSLRCIIGYSMKIGNIYRSITVEEETQWCVSHVKDLCCQQCLSHASISFVIRAGNQRLVETPKPPPIKATMDQ